ncbi:MAG: LPS export ABC transporter periplasmic protein LptC [Gemmatimonadales bacterium]
MANVRLAITTDGARSAVVSADSASTTTDALDLTFIRMRLTVFADDGQPLANLTAPGGRHRIGGDTVLATGGVVLSSVTGDTLWTPRLRFEKSVEQFVTDTTYTLRLNGARSSGTGLRTDLTLRPRPKRS